MDSKIIFLGTGGDSSVVGKQMRASGGIIIQVEGYQFHIDPGPGALTQARMMDVNLRNNTAVFVSHAHTNHCNDVNAVIDSMTLSGIDKQGVLVCSSSLINGTDNISPYLTKHHAGCVEKVIVLSPNQKVGINNTEVRAIPTTHCDQTNIGFKFFTPGFVLSYSSDTKYNAEAMSFYKNSDILILNVVNPSGIKHDDQLNTDDAVKIIEQGSPQLAVLTHFGIKLMKADPLFEAREVQKKTGVQTVSAKDGTVINPVSYAASLRQKTLNLY